MGKRQVLTEEQWAAIRHAWEYDPDEPTYLEAARRAGAKFGFEPPGKSTIAERAAAEKWERRGSLAGVNAAAQRKADKLLPDGPDTQADGQANASGDKKGPAPPDVGLAQSHREEAEDLRAGVIARHRNEWVQVAGLRQEALAKRPKKGPSGAPIAGSGSVAEAFEAAKLAKITAEMTAIQQAGERKAWGLDVVVDPEQLKNMSDDDLKALAEGRAPRR